MDFENKKAKLLLFLCSALFVAGCLPTPDNLANRDALVAAAGSSTTSTTPASGTTTTTATSVSKKIFVTAATFNGQLGTGAFGTGVSGADAKCMADANYPGTGTYKALIADGVDRAPNAGAQIDWVLQANVSYYRSDGTTLIAQADSNGQFTFPLTNSIGTGGALCWTGINTSWQTDQECVRWTSSVGGTGNKGDTAATNNTSIFSTSPMCMNVSPLCCVEQ